MLEDFEKKNRKLDVRQDYQPREKPKTLFRKLPPDEKRKLIEREPCFGKIVCRCETITEGEILEALDSPVMPASIEAIKRRTRAGMGRCQGGFCQPRVIEILAKKLGRDWSEINFSEQGTNFLEKMHK